MLCQQCYIHLVRCIRKFIQTSGVPKSRGIVIKKKNTGRLFMTEVTVNAFNRYMLSCACTVSARLPGTASQAAEEAEPRRRPGLK